MQRAAQATIEILQGKDILSQGMENARRLWNYTWWCLVGYNRRLARQRGDFGSKKDKLGRYPGKFTIQKELQDYSAYRDLSDRCASYTVKDFDIAMRSWFSNLRSNPQARPPRPLKKEQGRTLTFEVGRNAKPIGNFEYKLTVLGGHIPERHIVIRVHLRHGVNMESVKLIRLKPTQKDGWYNASIILNLPDAEPAPPPERYAALDLGIVNLGALVFENGESILYNGRALLSELRLAEKRAAKCKPSCWFPGKTRLPMSERQRSYKHKGTDIIAMAIHNFTSSVIAECVQRQVTTLIVGKLTGIREGKDFGKIGNQKFHRWPHLEIRRQLAYKGEEVGIKVTERSEAYTSATCCLCGTINKASRVERGLFVCQGCGQTMNADVNAGFNQLFKVSPRALTERQAVLGVGAGFSSPPSTLSEGFVPAEGIGEAARFARRPTWSAKFDLRDWSMSLRPC